MNLRILKKLSKRAAPFLEALDDTRGQFLAEGDNEMQTYINERKHWCRRRCHRWDEKPRYGAIHTRPRKGEGMIVQNRDYLSPWPGTVMVGCMSGGYESEWSEQTAWCSLHDRVESHFMAFIEGAECPETGYTEQQIVYLRRLPTARHVLAALPEVLADIERQHQERERDREAARQRWATIGEQL